MATVKQNIFSIVLVGRQNPQILNHDFLVKWDILPKEPPFMRKDFKDGETPYKEFFCTPPVAKITYDNYSILVQEDRFQALDETGNSPPESPIIAITTNYFGKRLRYTPFTVGGLNLHFGLTFASRDEEAKTDELLGVNRAIASKAFDADQLSIGLTASFPYLDGRLLVALTKAREGSNVASLGFNYEFKFADDIDRFLEQLKCVSQVRAYAAQFIHRLGVANV